MKVNLNIERKGEREVSGSIIRWVIETPVRSETVVDGDCILEFSGWVTPQSGANPISAVIVTDDNGDISSYPLRVKRPDVVNKVVTAAEDRAPLIRCGFSFGISLKEGRFEVHFLVLDEKIHIGTISASTSNVIIGKNRWLFLGNDTNKSVSQYLRDFVPTTSWTEQWSSYFSSVKRVSDQYELSPIVLVSPTKEEIFPDYYPYKKGEKTAVDVLLDRFGAELPSYWPKEDLMRRREFSYDAAETHWNDYGGWFVAKETMARLGVMLPSLLHHPHFDIREETGDLGFKLTPRLIVPRLKIVLEHKSKLIFDNYVVNHGRIKIFENKQAPSPSSVIIFGGSSSEALLPTFREAFSRVVYAHTAGGFDPKLIERERPKFVVIQFAQRFVVQPSFAGWNTQDVASKKLSLKDGVASQATAENISVFGDSSVELYVRNTLDALQ